MKFDCKNMMNVLLANRKMRISDLAEALGCVPSNLMNKRKRNDLRVGELLDMAEALDYEMKIVFIDRRSGGEFIFDKEGE